MVDYEFIFDYNTLIRKYINNKIAEATWNIISEECVELRSKKMLTLLAKVITLVKLLWSSPPGTPE